MARISPHRASTVRHNPGVKRVDWGVIVPRMRLTDAQTDRAKRERERERRDRRQKADRDRDRHKRQTQTQKREYRQSTERDSPTPPAWRPPEHPPYALGSAPENVGRPPNISPCPFQPLRSASPC